MPRTRAPYPAEFREEMIRLVRAGRSSGHSFDSLTQKATARLFELTLHPQPGVLPLERPSRSPRLISSWRTQFPSVES